MLIWYNYTNQILLTSISILIEYALFGILYQTMYLTFDIIPKKPGIITDYTKQNFPRQSWKRLPSAPERLLIIAARNPATITPRKAIYEM